MSSSPSSLTRIGGQSGEGSSSERTAGIQYSRKTLPMGVPGPTRQRYSLSTLLSIQFSFYSQGQIEIANPFYCENDWLCPHSALLASQRFDSFHHLSAARERAGRIFNVEGI